MSTLQPSSEVVKRATNTMAKRLQREFDVGEIQKISTTDNRGQIDVTFDSQTLSKDIRPFVEDATILYNGRAYTMDWKRYEPPLKGEKGTYIEFAVVGEDV